MKRVLLPLVGAAALVFACDGRFEFEEEGADGTAGEDQGPPDDGNDCHECGECDECEELGMVCDRDGYPCVECLSDEHCRDNSRPRCDKGLRRCVGCDDQSNCPLGFTCDAVTRSCVIGCATATTQPTCDRDFDYCNEFLGVCAVCGDDRDCNYSSTGSHCVESGTRCVECRWHGDCFDYEVCDPVLFRCVECSSSADCPHGKQCDLRSHECVQALETSGRLR